MKVKRQNLSTQGQEHIGSQDHMGSCIMTLDKAGKGDSSSVPFLIMAQFI